MVWECWIKRTFHGIWDLILGLGFWCLTPLSTIFQLNHGGQLEETGVCGENHWPHTSHWLTVLRNVVSSTSCLVGIQTHNFIGDRYWLHR